MSVYFMKRGKLKLFGFNNLTKTLSFNMYDICYASTEQERKKYIAYIDEQYSAERLTQILNEVADTIGAIVLNTAQQDYDPQGASVTMLIAEEEVEKQDVVMHLDKSHITVHTYPEMHPQDGICTFRADIDVSTCGKISPLKALNYLLKSFDADIVITGEGRLDGQTVMGKAPIGIARLAKKYGKPVLAFSGSVTEDAASCNEAGIDAFFPILRQVTTLEEAMDPQTAQKNMESAVEQVFRVIRLKERNW